MDALTTESWKRILRSQRFIRWLPFIILIAILVIVGIKGWRIYQKGLIVYEDVDTLRALARTPVNEMDLERVASTMTSLQGSLNGFTQEVKPLLWLTSRLDWVPTYGGDLSNASRLIELAERLVDASVSSLQAGLPILEELNSPDTALDPAGYTELLIKAQPQLLTARAEFDQALEARNRIQIDELSPRLRGLVADDLDPLMTLMDDGLSLSTTLPVVLGADGNGSKSYLLLVQNEDELRPTGGFITTVGKLTVQDGQILSLDFEGVDNEEDWSKPFPVAPWPLQEYMNARVLILRDSNWFTDFPTSASWAEYLYTYNHPEPLDGVIAFDQQFLVLLLRALGPLNVDGAPYPVTSDNVIEFMRSAKEPPADETSLDGWYRKEFIGDIADAILEELMGGQQNDWRGLVVMLIQALEERHLLLQFDDPMLGSLLVKHDWDNAVRPFEGDFLMTTDSNIGFNKTNALMDVSLYYSIDLTDLSIPTASLVITHINNSSKDVQCIHFDEQAPEDYYYPMNRCYWNYLRVYKQAGVELLNASPHDIPAEWILLETDVPARVDFLDEEIENIQGFGTLLVVPGGQSLNTGFDFALPASVVLREDGSNTFTYRLKVQKQPGTLANPLLIRVRLPNRAQVETVNMDAVIQDDDLLMETVLRTDVYLEVVFHVK